MAFKLKPSIRQGLKPLSQSLSPLKRTNNTILRTVFEEGDEDADSVKAFKKSE